jgi:PAS domain S-box-containing protein
MSQDAVAEPIRILLLEDSTPDADLIRAHLARLPAPADVVVAVGRDEYLEALQLDGFDVILADYSLPGFDGVSALDIAREAAPETPFIFVSGVLGEEIAVESFKRGATDYVLKQRLNGLPSAVERALRQSAERRERQRAEARYRALVEALGTVVWTTDPEGRVADMPQWRALTGQTPDQVRGFGWLDAIHPEDRAGVDTLWRTAVHTRGVYNIEYRLRRADGGYAWYNARGVPVLDDAGEVREWVGVCIDIDDRKTSEDHLQLLVHELNHRVKNNLATVQALAMQTLRGTESLPQARQAFLSRLMALAGAHDILTREGWDRAHLAEIAEGAVRHFGGGSDRLRVHGPPVTLNAKSALALSMALHELSTNAVKYGALSTPEGGVDLAWRVEEGPEARLLLTWTERDGPPVTPPQTRGFGSRLLERGLASELRGSVRLEFRPAGVICTIEARRWAEPAEAETK